MKKSLLCVLAISTLFLIGCGIIPTPETSPSDTGSTVETPVTPIVSDETGTQATVAEVSGTGQVIPDPIISPTVSYCKPDEDLDFALDREDETYYYFSGEKTLEFIYTQTSPEAIPTLETKINQSCRFQPTKGYLVQQDEIKKDFGLATGWEKSTSCAPNNQPPTATGKVALKVKGFKISKDYIVRYNKDRIKGAYEMRKYQFYLDYEGLPQVITPIEVQCPSTQ